MVNAHCCPAGGGAWSPPVPTREQLEGREVMKLITCIIRSERLTAVKEALFRAGVTGITLSRVSGHGGERDFVRQYRTNDVVLEFHDKVKIEMACSEPFVEPTIEAIVSAARTGAVGDGKIFVQALDRVVRIRTGERDNAALTPVTATQVQRRAIESNEPPLKLSTG
jgi:nitrogen regulatory protein P-II 1